MPAPVFELPIFTNLATTSDDAPAGEILTTEDLLRGDCLCNHAIYLINSHNFGFACPINSRVIVDLTAEDIEDQSLVIALHRERIFARRSVVDSQNPHLITLTSEAEISFQRPPALCLPADEVRVLRVVGVLLDDAPIYIRQKEEAILVGGCASLDKVKIAYKVRGSSAVPLAYPGQMVLCGGKILPSELPTMEGQWVAICTSDGEALKRVGQALPGFPYIRQFELIGSLGSTMVVRTEDIEGSPTRLPLMTSARQMLGILY
jgi:hypothetical protein